MTPPPTDGDVEPVSYRIARHGFELFADLGPAGWALRGFAIEQVAAFSQHGGPPVQTKRYTTAEAAQDDAGRILDAGARFAADLATLLPAPDPGA